MARITLWGFYQYSDKTLFDDCPLYEQLNKDILVNLILQQSGELFPFHQQPDYLRANITNWFTRKYEDFKRMYDTLYSEYNPIENYDRMEHWSDSESTSIKESESTSESGSVSTSMSSSESTSSSGSTHDSTSDSTSNSLTNDISAANMTTGFLPDSASNGISAGRSTADTNNTTATTQQGANHSLQSRQELSRHDYGHDKKNYFDHEGRVHGNIGVTTTQQMINQELELRKFDIYLTIANMFESEFIVRIY